MSSLKIETLARALNAFFLPLYAFFLKPKSNFGGGGNLPICMNSNLSSKNLPC